MARRLRPRFRPKGGNVTPPPGGGGGGGGSDTGEIRGNNKVITTLNVAPVTTTAIRLKILAAAGGPGNSYPNPRATAVEAYDNSTNVALASAGSTAWATTSESGFGPDKLINGDRTGANGRWDTYALLPPQHAIIQFNATRTINQIVIVGCQTGQATLTPTESMTSDLAIIDADVQYYSEQYGWVTFGQAPVLPEAVLTGSALPLSYTIGSGAFTTGVVVPEGEAPTTLAISGVDSYQVVVKNRWPDNSVKFAIISGQNSSAGAKSITASGSSPSGTITPTWPTASVTLTGVTNLTGTYVATLPAYSSANPWLNGPVCNDMRVDTTLIRTSDSSVHPYLFARWDIRCYQNGQYRVDVSVFNAATAGGASFYEANINFTVAGVTRFDTTVHAPTGPFKLFYRSGFNRIYESTAPATVAEDYRGAILAKAIPQFGTDIPSRVYNPDVISSRFVIGERGGITVTGMETPGNTDRGELAPRPDWEAQYVVEKHATTKRYMLETGRLLPSWPIHGFDTSYRIVRVDRAPGHATWSRNDMGGPTWQTMGSIHTLKPDAAHFPSWGFIPYLTTGDRFFADQVRFAANWHATLWEPGSNGWYQRIDVDNAYRTAPSNFTRLINSPGREARGYAWGLRCVVDAAAYLPDADDDKAYFVQCVSENLQRSDIEADAPYGGSTQYTPAPSSALGLKPLYVAIGHDLAAGGANRYGNWNQWQIGGMLLFSLDHAINQKMWGNHGKAARLALVSTVVALMSHRADGLDPRVMNANYVVLGSSNPRESSFNSNSPAWNVPQMIWHTSWASIWTDTLAIAQAASGGVIPAWSGSHCLEMALPLHVASTLGVTGGLAVWNYLHDGHPDTQGVDSVLRSRPGWRIVRGSMGSVA